MAAIAASLVTLLLVAPVAVYAATYEVKWTLGEDYSSWASKNVYVGDTIEFTYGGTHNVYVVSKAGYSNCDTSGNSFSDNSGSTKYALTKEGAVYFICGTPGHCPGGMQLQLNVLAASSSTNNTTPTSTTLSPPSSTTSPSTPKGSAAAASHGLSWLVVGVSVIFAAFA